MTQVNKIKLGESKKGKIVPFGMRFATFEDLGADEVEEDDEEYSQEMEFSDEEVGESASKNETVEDEDESDY